MKSIYLILAILFSVGMFSDLGVFLVNFCAVGFGYCFASFLLLD